MKKKYSFLLLFTLSAIISTATVLEEKLLIHFQSDEFKLTCEHEMKIQIFLENLSLKGDYEFLVKGHTDQDGSVKYNLELSEKRAQSIISYLNISGVPLELAAMQYAGEYELLSGNLDPTSKQKNRRVEITFKKYEFNSISEIENELAKENFTYDQMNSDEDHMLIGKHGTFIKINPNSFLTESGKTYTGEIDLVLQEALTISDFVAHGLSTLADGQILVSGGMYKIEALARDGSPLVLDPKSPVQVAMPSENIQEGMSIFTSQNGDNWEITNQQPQSQLALVFPKRPNLTYPKYYKPIYKEDTSKKPFRPSEPRKPKQPKKPNPENYTVNLKWWQIFMKPALERKAEERYQKALESYDLKLEKYHDRYERFLAYEKSYPKRLHDYIQKMKSWEKSMEDAFTEFHEVHLPAHYEKWRESVADRKIAHDLACEKWREECDQVTEKYLTQMDEMGIADNGQAANYAFSQSKLGWLNIDKFRKPGPVREIIVSTPDPTPEEKVILLFTESYSCFNMPWSENGRKQEGVPANEKIKVIAYKIENGQVFYAEKDATETNKISVEYSPMKFSTFRKKIGALGNSTS